MKSPLRNTVTALFLGALFATAHSAPQPLNHETPQIDYEISQNQFTSSGVSNRNISGDLFSELEEFSRIVDIAYCVGVSGIYKPFSCAGRCSEFPGWELIDTWNTGPLLSDSCGYIALDHLGGRIIVAFRGTYSVANTIVDLSTVPQDYVPYPGEDGEGHDGEHGGRGWWDRVRHPLGGRRRAKADEDSEHILSLPKSSLKCTNCTVHSGFYSSWLHTRPEIIPHVLNARDSLPNYKLHLVGHSLGGAVAALAGIEFDLMGLEPTITTFGEPRIGNLGLRNWLDALFELEPEMADTSRYRRVTHVDDPVPLLPLQEWGFKMHAGEIYISKPSLSPQLDDIEACHGDEDRSCIAGQEDSEENDSAAAEQANRLAMDVLKLRPEEMVGAESWGLPARYKMWQLFFAHRDYFWRLGLCLPGDYPYDWGGGKKYGQKETAMELEL